MNIGQEAGQRRQMVTISESWLQVAQLFNDGITFAPIVSTVQVAPLIQLLQPLSLGLQSVSLFLRVVIGLHQLASCREDSLLVVARNVESRQIGGYLCLIDAEVGGPVCTIPSFVSVVTAEPRFPFVRGLDMDSTFAFPAVGEAG
jgi:hypothetical protein